ncbi:hypothetical protein QTP88_029552 [Uroleucon formosanum]
MRSKKWYMKIFYHLVDMSIVNAWMLYKKVTKKPMKLAQFREQLAVELCQTEMEIKKRGRKTKESLEKQMLEDLEKRKKRTPTAIIPSTQIRLDGHQHRIQFEKIRRVYVCFFFTMSNKRSLKCLNVGDKLKIIKEVEKGVKRKKDIAADFNIPANTLSSILKNKDKIVKNIEDSSCSPQRKKLKVSNFPQIEDAILKWIHRARDHNLPVSGPLIQEKAKEFA